MRKCPWRTAGPWILFAFYSHVYCFENWCHLFKREGNRSRGLAIICITFLNYSAYRRSMSKARPSTSLTAMVALLTVPLAAPNTPAMLALEDKADIVSSRSSRSASWSPSAPLSQASTTMVGTGSNFLSSFLFIEDSGCCKQKQKLPLLQTHYKTFTLAL